MSQRLLISLCTYNERENLTTLIPAIFEAAPDAHLLVVDDSSPDGTGEYADELAAANPAVHVLHRAGKLGLGTAIVAAMQYAVDNDYDFLINMDADFSHHPRHIPALRDCVERVDVGIGSRYVPGGGVEGWGFTRHFMSRGINFYARLLLGLKTRDNSGSFRCYRVSRLAELDLNAIRSHGYSFQEEILYRLRRVGCTFEETPILFENRRCGESKINSGEAVRSLGVILQLGFDRLRGVPVTRPQSADVPTASEP